MKRIFLIVFLLFGFLSLRAGNFHTVPIYGTSGVEEADTTSGSPTVLYARLFVEYTSGFGVNMLKQKKFQPRIIKFVDENGKLEIFSSVTEPEVLNLLTGRGYRVLDSDTASYELETGVMVLCTHLLARDTKGDRP